MKYNNIVKDYNQKLKDLGEKQEKYQEIPLD